ncbi:MAG: bifunctional ADP-dependent NAD(P)H-hydrate dehydratase/NAD(P)H-hydrate epimerase, partial [Bacteroidaceae bacterium]|nr:bifunctional ADP-dependent NAD(P)H-hydrate dehydratase/NAD(P)H-hydrate epimerase [Bacteroidaceae bacterium]
MKLLTKSQIKELDQRTIEEENIPSIELMERAATVLANAIKHMFQQPCTFKIFAGPGNNGGDALAIARMLSESGHK